MPWHSRVASGAETGRRWYLRQTRRSMGMEPARRVGPTRRCVLMEAPVKDRGLNALLEEELGRQSSRPLTMCLTWEASLGPKRAKSGKEVRGPQGRTSQRLICCCSVGTCRPVVSSACDGTTAKTFQCWGQGLFGNVLM